jgi:hypothetical protein
MCNRSLVGKLLPYIHHPNMQKVAAWSVGEQEYWQAWVEMILEVIPRMLM